MQENTIESKYIYDGKVVRLRLDTVKIAESLTTQREIVEHGESVVVVPLNNDNKIILVKQYRKATEKFLLEAPAGGIESGETPDDAARRELQEEIGLATKDLEFLGGFWIAPGFCTEYMYAYVARDLVVSKLAEDEDENIQIVPVDLEQIPDMIRSGEIEDAKSISSLMMALYLNKVLL